MKFRRRGWLALLAQHRTENESIRTFGECEGLHTLKETEHACFVGLLSTEQVEHDIINEFAAP